MPRSRTAASGKGRAASQNATIGRYAGSRGFRRVLPELLRTCLLLREPGDTGNTQRHVDGDRARLSIAIPVSAIVAVAIICVVVAVLSSAKRADEVALENEQELFARAINRRGDRVLR